MMVLSETRIWSHLYSKIQIQCRLKKLQNNSFYCYSYKFQLTKYLYIKFSLAYPKICISAFYTIKQKGTLPCLSLLTH